MVEMGANTHTHTQTHTLHAHTYIKKKKKPSSTGASFTVKRLIISRKKKNFHQMRCSPGLYIKNAYQSKEKWT